MQLRLSKKKSIIITSIFFAILAGTGGYLLWRVNNKETLAEVPGLAANCRVVCNRTSNGTIISGNCTDPERCAGYTNENGGQSMCEYSTICDEEAPEVCGNGVCVSGVENVTSCPTDCSVCGDNSCTGPETVASCPGDCATCGDNVCTSPTETLANCPKDCAKCGDNVCTSPTETLASCPGDCSVCGDNKCTGTETLASCPGDCSVCGDKKCTGAETLASCPGDCANCGDKICSSTETLTSCPGDCAKCGDKICTSPNETVASCPGDCATCGDKICSSTETSTSCALDCACKAMTWVNKPTGSYKPDITTVNTLSPITITNPNSTSTTTTGIAIKINNTTLTQCSGGITGASCFSVSANTAKQQLVTLTLFGGQPTVAEGTYTLSVTLPGASDACVELASFTVAADAVAEVPDTGLFDGVMGKIYLGMGLVFLGIVTTQFPKFGYLFNTLGERNKVILEEKKRKREENKRNRFERRFK